METPDWLRGGNVIVDPEGERWTIRSVDPIRITVGHPERGEHRLLREDLIEWVEHGEWDAIE